jgi:cation transport ATPase
MTSSDFCLLSADLTGILTTFSLARATYDKIATNFIWALVFNAVLLPLAAGAFYWFGETRLPPVWASLAMACSSVSVVCNALLLRLTFRVPKDARVIQEEQEAQ